MKVAVIGSRKLYNCTVEQIISHIPQNASELVSGGAIGVDQLAQEAAHRLALPIRIFPPDYEKNGKQAPLIRNAQIVDYADLVLAFWDNRSRGTAYTLNLCVKTNTPFRIISITK